MNTILQVVGAIVLVAFVIVSLFVFISVYELGQHVADLRDRVDKLEDRAIEGARE